MGTLAGDLCCREKLEPRGGTPTAWVHSPVTCAVGENLNQGEELLQHGYARR